MTTKTKTRMALHEWMAEGQRRFGDDMMLWRFVCPVCGNVQTVKDFEPYKDQGATPDDARQNCIGRFMPADQVGNIGGGGPPCDYAAYGLLRLAPLIIVWPDGKECDCFAFDGGGQTRLAGGLLPAGAGGCPAAPPPPN